MALIDNANQLHKMSSVLIAGAGLFATVAEQVLPALQGILPPGWQAVAFVAIAIARAIKQPALAK